ncbi:hypothetical protein PQC31_gp79 [Pseudomonas phage Iggy]|uniref:Uncharacterized protein n=1 Tax=Pseudomonas phage Iggy TaxID=2592193 RepID=A0A7S5AYY6_9CAUD|nr:hypothetical protein PQC31_gp79 [Pseudomonas phage Iggy]QEA09800.1 hypothetical protein [Pseudomonas phage Iggy]
MRAEAMVVVAICLMLAGAVLSSMGASQRPALVGFVSLVLGVLLSIAASQLVVIAMLGWH